MQEHRNIGAPFTRADGTTWERDAVATPTPAELTRWGHKLVATTASAPPDSAPPEPTPAADDARPFASEGWTLRLTPARYLEKHPHGQFAALARRLVEADRG